MRTNPGVVAGIHTIKGDDDLIDGDDWGIQISKELKRAMLKEVIAQMNIVLEYQLRCRDDDSGLSSWAALAGAFDIDYKPGDIDFFMHLDGNSHPRFRFNILDLVEYEIEGVECAPGQADAEDLVRLKVLADALEKGAKRLRGIELYKCPPTTSQTHKTA